MADFGTHLKIVLVSGDEKAKNFSNVYLLNGENISVALTLFCSGICWAILFYECDCWINTDGRSKFNPASHHLFPGGYCRRETEIDDPLLRAGIVSFAKSPPSLRAGEREREREIK
jgi:hypothetical protein